MVVDERGVVAELGIDRSTHLVRAPETRLRELEERQHDAVRCHELERALHELSTLGCIRFVVGVVEQVGSFLVAPTLRVLTLVAVRFGRNLVAGERRREVTRVRRSGRDVHRHVVVQGWETLLEVASRVAVVCAHLEAGRVEQRNQVGLGVLATGVARVDDPADVRSGTGRRIDPVAVGTLGPTVLRQQCFGTGRVVRIGELVAVAVRARDDRATLQRRFATERHVNLLEERIAVDRLRERCTEDRVSERSALLLEVEALVVSAELFLQRDVRVGKRLFDTAVELRVHEVDFAGLQRCGLGVAVSQRHHDELLGDGLVGAPVLVVRNVHHLAGAPRLHLPRATREVEEVSEVRRDV